MCEIQQMSKSKYKKETKERKNWMERKFFEEIIMPNFPELKARLNKSYGKLFLGWRGG